MGNLPCTATCIILVFTVASLSLPSNPSGSDGDLRLSYNPSGLDGKDTKILANAYWLLVGIQYILWCLLWSDSSRIEQIKNTWVSSFFSTVPVCRTRITVEKNNHKNPSTLKGIGQQYHLRLLLMTTSEHTAPEVTKITNKMNNNTINWVKNRFWSKWPVM